MSLETASLEDMRNSLLALQTKVKELAVVTPQKSSNGILEDALILLDEFSQEKLSPEYRKVLIDKGADLRLRYARTHSTETLVAAIAKQTKHREEM